MARRQGPARRRGAEALTSSSPEARGYVVATRDDIAAAITAGATTLVTAPGVAHAAGPAWVAGIVRRLKPTTPPTIVYDVGEDAALGHALCINRDSIIFTGSAKFRAILVATFPGQVWRGIARDGRLR